MEKLLKEVRGNFEDPIDPRLEDGGDEEWTARVNTVSIWIGQEASNSELFAIAEILIEKAGIKKDEPK